MDASQIRSLTLELQAKDVKKQQKAGPGTPGAPGDPGRRCFFWLAAKALKSLQNLVSKGNNICHLHLIQVRVGHLGSEVRNQQVTSHPYLLVQTPSQACQNHHDLTAHGPVEAYYCNSRDFWASHGPKRRCFSTVKQHSYVCDVCAHVVAYNSDIHAFFFWGIFGEMGSSLRNLQKSAEHSQSSVPGHRL